MQSPAPALILGSFLAAVLAVAVPGLAQGPAIQIEEIECLPEEDNGVIYATVQPEVGGAETRLYFRWEEHGPFYYVVMQAAGGGRYWATPPKPIEENDQVEAYVAVANPAGEVVGEASEPVLIPVTETCDALLNQHEEGMAENLVVGETEDEQRDDYVVGFLCDGIISRIDPEGVLRADGRCRRCIVAWWDKPEALLPAAVLLGAGGRTIEIEASPSRP